MSYKKQQMEYKGLRIVARRRYRFPFYYAIIYRPDGSVIGRAERDEEGGIESAHQALEIAAWEIDQGYHK